MDSKKLVPGAKYFKSTMNRVLAKIDSVKNLIATDSQEQRSISIID
jgi:hypothetical protein